MEKKKESQKRRKEEGLENGKWIRCGFRSVQSVHKKKKRKRKKKEEKKKKGKKERKKKKEHGLTGYMSNFCFHSDLLAGHLVTWISAIKSTFVPTFSLSHLDVSIAGPVPRQLEKYLTLIALLAVSFISTELEMASYCSRISSTTLLESSDNFPAKEPSTCFVSRL